MSVIPWPLREARRLLQRPRTGRPILLEAGFGPSGPPHVGTLAECLRTSWVGRAWTAISGESHDFIVFSDDMDGLRRAPQGMEDSLNRFRGLPLCEVPDPDGQYESWGHRNLALLLDMLTNSGLNCRMQLASATYRSGQFDALMLRVLEEHERVAEVVRPTLGPALRDSWTPFMPVHPVTGHVLSVPVRPVPEEGSIEWADPASGRLMRTPVTGGHAKLGWKADWAMRWAALGVDWEMNGKDLAENRPLSERICTILGGNPPLGMTAELLLDENGAKLSKSRGGGMTVQEWTSLGGPESLSLLLMGAPEEARRFHKGLISPTVDSLVEGADRLASLQADGEPVDVLMQDPAWYAIPDGMISRYASGLRFPLVMGAARMLRGQDVDAVIHVLSNHAHGLGGELDEGARRMAVHAHAIVADDGFSPRAPLPEEGEAILVLVEALRGLSSDSPCDEVQAEAYRVGKEVYGKSRLRAWFAMLYEVLLAQPDGPRFGNLAEIMGLPRMITALEGAVMRADHPPSPAP